MEQERKKRLESAVKGYVQAVHVLDSVRLQVWERRGITLPQLRILSRVRARPGVDLRGLACDLGITASGASQQVDKLVAGGFLLRQEDPQDRRRMRLQLADLGEQAMGEISSASRAYLEAVLGVLSNRELEQLSWLLARVVAAGAERGVPSLGATGVPVAGLMPPGGPGGGD